ncbi:HesB/IscA family protein [Tunicatimonas pelagia]|uniref:HesB/IscA family protein n=1 Tax=Tunicatimonas pelagia TaxID=931531 RepID=UPI0026671036|nr:iron-sulfur cluster assembly accessory protein [Tunicatimonas pelagia]WKN45976.1 iron-sulfur cluster assembly accessory protein [Tunicatimonas pelagia]
MIPVSLSDRALEEVKNTLTHKNIPPGYGLRVGIKGAGCAGISYILGFDQKSEKDMEYNLEGVPLYVAKKDVMYLLGVQVDFYEGNDARGFTFVKS